MSLMSDGASKLATATSFDANSALRTFLGALFARPSLTAGDTLAVALRFSICKEMEMTMLQLDNK